MGSPDHRCEEFDLAADAWEWLHTESALNNPQVIDLVCSFAD
ncbi:hypothetical protein [Acidovorax sp. NCPPB 3576]|nr:hypothetical protein [Acidovorax sp. NCPPB 3576]